MNKWMKRGSALILCGLLTLGGVYGNSSAPEWDPETMRLYFDPESGIQLEDEILIATLSDDYTSMHFTVDYRFSNVSGEVINRPIWFINKIMDTTSFEITIDGRAVETETVTVQEGQVTNWSFDREADYVTPWDGAKVDAYWGYGPEWTAFPVVAFDLEMEPGQSVDVGIDFDSRTGYIRRNAYFSNLTTSQYWLSPAGFYEGEAAVDLYLNVPVDCMVGSNISLTDLGGGQYSRLDVPIGDEDWYLTFLDREDLFFGTNLRSRYYRALQILLAGLIIALIPFWKRRRIRRLLLVGCLLTGLAFLAHPTYGMGFMMVMAAPVVLVVLVLGLSIYFSFRHRRRNNEHD